MRVLRISNHYVIENLQEQKALCSAKKRSIGDFLFSKGFLHLCWVSCQDSSASECEGVNILLSHFFRVADYPSRARVVLNGSGDCFECRKFEYCALAMSLSKVLPR